jgi:hypothetical protein
MFTEIIRRLLTEHFGEADERLIFKLNLEAHKYFKYRKGPSDDERTSNVLSGQESNDRVHHWTI